MATIRWIGGAAGQAQLNTWTFAGSWSASETVTVVVGQKSWTYTLTSGTIATFLPLLEAAYNALDAADYPEMAEMTADSTSTTLTLTADEAGRPFTCTISTNSASGTINGSSSSTGTATTASAGPQDWSTAANWSGGSVPTTGDSVYLEDSEDDIKYGLDQSSVTLTLLEVRGTFTGTVGLPAVNQDGTAYPEYRSRYLSASATTLNVGSGVGSGSGRLLINTGSNACALTVYGTASGLDGDAGALQWKGAHASNTATIYRGSLDVARLAGDAATIATLRVGYETSQDSDAAVTCSSGVTLTTVTQTGGDLTLNSAATTITRTGGTLTVYGSGAITTLTNHAGTVNYAGTGTVTTYVGGGGSVLDFSRSMLARTFTTTTLRAGATLLDPHGVVTFSNGVVLSNCRLSDVSLDVGYSRTLTPS